MFAASLWGSASAFAAVLSLVIDASDEAASCWWCEPPDDTPSALDEAIRLRGASTVWASTAESDVSEASLLLRTPNLTLANARNLASLYGARHALIGTLSRDAAPPVPWLGLERAAYRVDAVLIDVATGAEADTMSIRAVAFGQDATEATRAAAELLAARIEERLLPLTVDGSDNGVDVGQPVFVIGGAGQAGPYVAFRGALREIHPGVIDVEEVWATEGSIAIRPVLDEGTTFPEVQRAVESMVGVVRDGVLVDDVRADGDRIWVTVSTPRTE